MNAAAQDPIAQFVVYAVMACWIVLLTAFVLRSRRVMAREIRRERGAVAGMALQFLCYLAVWLPVTQRHPLSAIVAMPASAEWLLAGVTIVIAAGSVWLVEAASRQLGKQWALAARLVEGHELITGGPYRVVRNPVYLGMLGLLVATAVARCEGWVVMAATAIFVLGTVIRIRNEQRLLREQFGAAFEAYARRVPALIPGIY